MNTLAEILNLFEYHESNTSWYFKGDLDKARAAFMAEDLSIWEGMYDETGIHMVTAALGRPATLEEWDIYGASDVSLEEAWRYLVGSEYLGHLGYGDDLTQEHVDEWGFDISALL